jgi:trehalose 6-phosphate phosphatase
VTDSRELPEDLQRALAEIARVERLLVASDFDGTIAPIVANPADARPIPAATEALGALAALPATTAALISGRALKDLGELSGAPADVHLVGSHGSEFNADFLDAIEESAKSLLADIEQTMAAIATQYPGASVEIKPVSVAFHVRNTAPEHAQAADTDKGQALNLLRQQGDATATVFFGDDVTDEKAFARLAASDVGVKVGDGDTRAGYRVEEPDDVATALRFLHDARSSWLST